MSCLNPSRKDYLSVYNEFFERIEKTSQECSSDPLPVHIGKYNILESEATGDILSWCMEYLNARGCPVSLLAPLSSSVLKEMKELIKKEPEYCGYRSVEGDFGSLRLMQTTIGKLVEVCLRYLGDSQLIEGLPPPPPSVAAPSVSAAAVKNSRRSMEDAHIVIHDLHALFNIQGWGVAGYYGVFDGHIGWDAALYSAAHLHQYLVQSVHYPADPVSALREAFTRTDQLFIDKSNRENLKSGTTGVSVLIRHDLGRLYVGWLGDSQGILVNGQDYIQLVQPHRPDQQEERERIEKLGGAVVYWGTWRVDGQLAVSRAIGDVDFKPYVSADADVSSYELTGDEDFLLLACDGLWDVLSPEGAIQEVWAALETNKEEGRQSVASRLVAKAKSLGSKDNITVVLVWLDMSSSPGGVLPSEEQLMSVPALLSSADQLGVPAQITADLRSDSQLTEEIPLPPLLRAIKSDLAAASADDVTTGGSASAALSSSSLPTSGGVPSTCPLVQKQLDKSAEQWLKTLPWSYADVLRRKPTPVSPVKKEPEVVASPPLLTSSQAEEVIKPPSKDDDGLLNDENETADDERRPADESDALVINRSAVTAAPADDHRSRTTSAVDDDGSVAALTATADSGAEEDSDGEEWNYIPTRHSHSRDNKENTSPLLNSPQSQSKTEVVGSSEGVILGGESEEDMDIRLNPDAAEFVPVSSDAAPSAVLQSADRLLDNEITISHSPLKSSELRSLDDVEIPSAKTFLREINSRPSELDMFGDDDLAGKRSSFNGDVTNSSTKAVFGDDTQLILDATAVATDDDSGDKDMFNDSTALHLDAATGGSDVSDPDHICGESPSVTAAASGDNIPTSASDDEKDICDNLKSTNPFATSSSQHHHDNEKKSSSDFVVVDEHFSIDSQDFGVKPLPNDDGDASQLGIGDAVKQSSVVDVLENSEGDGDAQSATAADDIVTKGTSSSLFGPETSVDDSEHEEDNEVDDIIGQVEKSDHFFDEAKYTQEMVSQALNNLNQQQPDSHHELTKSPNELHILKEHSDDDEISNESLIETEEHNEDFVKVSFEAQAMSAEQVILDNSPNPLHEDLTFSSEKKKNDIQEDLIIPVQETILTAETKNLNNIKDEIQIENGFDYNNHSEQTESTVKENDLLFDFMNQKQVENHEREIETIEISKGMTFDDCIAYVKEYEKKNPNETVHNEENIEQVCFMETKISEPLFSNSELDSFVVSNVKESDIDESDLVCSLQKNEHNESLIEEHHDIMKVTDTSVKSEDVIVKDDVKIAVKSEDMLLSTGEEQHHEGSSSADVSPIVEVHRSDDFISSSSAASSHQLLVGEQQEESAEDQLIVAPLAAATTADSDGVADSISVSSPAPAATAPEHEELIEEENIREHQLIVEDEMTSSMIDHGESSSGLIPASPNNLQELEVSVEKQANTTADSKDADSDSGFEIIQRSEATAAAIEMEAAGLMQSEKEVASAADEEKLTLDQDESTPLDDVTTREPQPTPPPTPASVAEPAAASAPLAALTTNGAAAVAAVVAAATATGVVATAATKATASSAGKKPTAAAAGKRVAGPTTAATKTTTGPTSTKSAAAAAAKPSAAAAAKPSAASAAKPSAATAKTAATKPTAAKPTAAAAKPSTTAKPAAAKTSTTVPSKTTSAVKSTTSSAAVSKSSSVAATAKPTSTTVSKTATSAPSSKSKVTSSKPSTPTSKPTTPSSAKPGLAAKPAAAAVPSKPAAIKKTTAPASAAAKPSAGAPAATTKLSAAAKPTTTLSAAKSTAATKPSPTLPKTNGTTVSKLLPNSRPTSSKSTSSSSSRPTSAASTAPLRATNATSAATKTAAAPIKRPAAPTAVKKPTSTTATADKSVKEAANNKLTVKKSTTLIGGNKKASTTDDNKKKAQIVEIESLTQSPIISTTNGHITNGLSSPTSIEFM